MRNFAADDYASIAEHLRKLRTAPVTSEASPTLPTVSLGSDAEKAANGRIDWASFGITSREKFLSVQKQQVVANVLNCRQNPKRCFYNVSNLCVHANSCRSQNP